MPFRAPTNTLFADLFQGWNRLEPRSRTDDFTAGLAAPTADGLWYLGRAFQVGELTGQDGGSPIHVKAEYEVANLDRIALGNDSFADTGEIPTEVLVEREKVPWDWRLRVRAGQQFERIARSIDPTGAEPLIESLKTGAAAIVAPSGDAWRDLDYASRRFVSLMAGRAIDGEKILNLIDTSGSGIPTAIANGMKQWYAKLYSQGSSVVSPAWKPQALEYQFNLMSTDAPASSLLEATAYRNGTIDWTTFSIANADTQPFRKEKPRYLTPTHLRFAGQAARRWFEFEDYAINFGVLDVATTDLGKFFLQFELLSGADDAFVVPLQVPTGSLIRLGTLSIRDTFGQWTTIERAHDSGKGLEKWDAFALSHTPPGITDDADLLYVPHASGIREESSPIEIVSFALDPGANVCWALETTVSNALGEPVTGLTAHFESLRRMREATLGATQPTVPPSETTVSSPSPVATPEASGRPTLQFVLGTKVPLNWIPFVAAQVDNGGRTLVKLRRAELVLPDGSETQAIITPESRLLAPVGAAALEWLDEEAVGREGVRVQLTRQRVRASDGETYVWVGRSIGVGRGESRSGLRFDVVQEETPSGSVPV